MRPQCCQDYYEQIKYIKTTTKTININDMDTHTHTQQNSECSEVCQFNQFSHENENWMRANTWKPKIAGIKSADEGTTFGLYKGPLIGCK